MRNLPGRQELGQRIEPGVRHFATQDSTTATELRRSGMGARPPSTRRPRAPSSANHDWFCGVTGAPARPPAPELF